jgi:hypothetical protein
MKIKPCPFCGGKVNLREHTVCQTFDSAGMSWDTLQNLPEQTIECNNIGVCAIRPRLSRVNTGDAIDIWNKRKH